MLNLYFLGKATFEYNGKNITESVGNKAIALICLLVLNQKKYFSREKIIAYLWPDSKEEAAKYNLRFNIWMIKKNIGPDENGEAFLYVDKDRCKINENYIFHCDILEIMNFQTGENNCIERLLALRSGFAGDFLEGCYFNNCNDFNEIIIFERRRFEDQRVKILKRLAELYEDADEMEKCEEILVEIMDIEPYDEEMALKMISLHVKRGKRSKAIIYYNNFRNRLAGGLGIEPSEKLHNAYEAIKAAAAEIAESEVTIGQKIIKNKTAEKGVLRISTDCIGPIPYFWMADVVGKLAICREIHYLDYLSENQLEALAYIQPEIAREADRRITVPMPDVRIINSFIGFIGSICVEFGLIIEIHNPTGMDENSKMVCQYLTNGHVTNLILEKHE